MELPATKKLFLGKIDNQTEANYYIFEYSKDKEIDAQVITPRSITSINRQLILENSPINKLILIFKSKPYAYDLALQINKDLENKLHILLGYIENNQFNQMLQQEHLDLKTNTTVDLLIHGDESQMSIIQEKSEVNKQPLEANKKPAPWKFWKSNKYKNS